MSVEFLKRRKDKMKLSKTDRVVTAFAEHAGGPGWGNTPIWIIVQDNKNKYRMECLQRDEQSAALFGLYEISESVHRAMVAAVDKMRRGDK